jgi:hypothetical protein
MGKFLVAWFSLILAVAGLSVWANAEVGEGVILSTTPTPTPSETPWPLMPTQTLAPTSTTDVQLSRDATQVYLSGVQIQQKQTLQSIAEIDGLKTLQASQATSTEVFGAAFATSTQMAYQTNTAPTAFTAMQSAELESSVKSGGWGIFVLLVLVGCFGWLVWLFRVTAPKKPVEEKLPSLPARVDILPDAEEPTINWKACPVDEIAVSEIARILSEGGRYTHAQMTGAGKPLVKSNGQAPGTFDLFGDWLIKNRMALRINGRYILYGDTKDKLQPPPHLTNIS